MALVWRKRGCRRQKKRSNIYEQTRIRARHLQIHFISLHFIWHPRPNTHTHTHTIQYSSSMLVYSIEHLRMRATQFNRSDKFAQQTIHEFSQKIRKVQRMANDRSMAAHAHVAIFLRIWKTATNMKTTTLLTNNSV